MPAKYNKRSTNSRKIYVKKRINKRANNFAYRSNMTTAATSLPSVSVKYFNMTMPHVITAKIPNNANFITIGLAW